MAHPTDATGPRRADRGIAIRIFLTCWCIYVAHFATNTVREIYPALSLGDDLSFDVSAYLGLHSDIFELPGRGAFINNNPGASIVGAIPYALARPVIDRVVAAVQQRRASAPDTVDSEAYNSIYPMARAFYRESRARGYDIKFGLGAAVMQAGAMAPLSAFSAVVMFWVLVACDLSRRGACVGSLLYAVGTPIFYRTAQLNHNLILAHCAFFAFVLLWRPWAPRGSLRPAHFFLAGLLAGFGVVCDYSGVIIVIAIGVYALRRWLELSAARRREHLVAFAAGLAIAAAFLVAYQWICFGHPLFPAQHYMPPAKYSDQGYAGFDWPHLDLLWDTAFGLRYGLFTSAPLLLLALYPPAWTSRLRIIGRVEIETIALLCALFLLFCSANQYGRMQFNTGVRHIIPVSAFLFLVAVGPLRHLPVTIAATFAGLTVFWSWCLAMYRDVEQGLGAPEAFLHVIREGPSLPWLSTIQNMGFVPQASATVILLLLFLGLILLWTVGPRPRLSLTSLQLGES